MLHHPPNSKGIENPTGAKEFYETGARPLEGGIECLKSWPYNQSYTLQNHRIPLPHPNTHGAKRVTPVSTLQFKCGR